MSQKTRDYGGRGNRRPRVTCKCGVCGKEMVLIPAEYRRRMKKSKTGKLYHKECYRESQKSPARKSTKFKTKLGTGRPYRVRGTKKLGYSISLPVPAVCSDEYTCEQKPGGVLVYTPVRGATQ